MPSKMQKRIQHARDRGCFVIHLPEECRDSNRLAWTVFIEGECNIRHPMSHRAAKNLAYAISIAKHQELEVKFG